MCWVGECHVKRNIPYLYLAETLAEWPAPKEVRVDPGGEDEGARDEVIGRHRREHEARLAAHATRSAGNKLNRKVVPMASKQSGFTYTGCPINRVVNVDASVLWRLGLVSSSL